MSNPTLQVSMFFQPLLRATKTFGLATAAVLIIGGAATAAENGPAGPDMQKLKQIMQEQVGLMKPELQQKVKKLSPKTQKSLIKILAQHSRYSNEVTLRQVMHEVLSDYHSMTAGIMTDNAEQAADSAMRLANHRIPVGGLLPYLGLENINDERLAILETFNDSVEGKAKALAKAARAGNMVEAASYLSDITSGCVACHNVFRDRPGPSDLLR